jgi:hypothetical protein
MEYEDVVRSSGARDRRRSGHRPGNGTTSGATRAAVCVTYVAHADAAEALAAEIVAAGGRCSPAPRATCGPGAAVAEKQPAP